MYRRINRSERQYCRCTITYDRGTYSETARYLATDSADTKANAITSAADPDRRRQLIAVITSLPADTVPDYFDTRNPD